MSIKECAFRIDPVLWVQKVLGEAPKGWQQQFLRAPRGASILALTARQVGKTTAACWAMAHTAIFKPRSLSVVACPAQRQSAEAIRRVRDNLARAGATLTVQNVYGLELENGARVLALPGTDDSVRGMTVDGWIVADEAARLSDELIAALRPMRARKPEARFSMLSTAWSRSDPFWQAWDGEDETYMRLKATADMPGVDLDPAFLDKERLALGEAGYLREYLGVPVGGGVSPFIWELYAQATGFFAPLVPAGPAFAPVRGQYSHEDPATWPGFHPLIIAHDVGRSRDRSTAVIGGNSVEPRRLGILELEELPVGLYGSARASALARIDRRHNHDALIVADLSNDATYAEVLHETFGPRVIGLQISRHGDGTQFERRPVRGGCVLVYTIGRTYLLELLHSKLQSRLVRIVPSKMAMKAYEQLEALEVEYRDTGTVYGCLPGHHDDLGISCAMLAWAACHPHLNYWHRDMRPVYPSSRPSMSAAAVWRACT